MCADGITHMINKQCDDNYITPLTHIINLSIAQEYFPDEWKVARSFVYLKMETLRYPKLPSNF